MTKSDLRMKDNFPLLKILFLISFSFLASKPSVAQVRFYAESSEVKFFSDGIIEDISAQNNNVTSIFDVRKNEIAFLIKIRDFEFEKKLMQVHFNEKFLESDKYPKATFLGNLSGFDIEKGRIQKVKADGKLFIHGVTRDASMTGTVEVKGRNLVMKSKFKVRLADYNITIPQVVWQNISEEVEVTVEFLYSPL